MTTTLRQSVSRLPLRSASDRLRQGYNGALSSATQMMACAQRLQDQKLYARAISLFDAVSNPLRVATQQALVHPTLQTLKDCFDTADVALVKVAQLARRTRGLKAAEAQVSVGVLLAGLRAGIAELESGLETIQLLPASAPDYPESD